MRRLLIIILFTSSAIVILPCIIVASIAVGIYKYIQIFVRYVRDIWKYEK